MGATAYNIKYKIATAIKYSLEIVSIFILLYLVTTASIAYCANTMDLKAVEDILTYLDDFKYYFTKEQAVFFIKNLNATVTDSQICEYFKLNPKTDTKMLYIIKQKFELFKLIKTQLVPCATTYKSYLINGTPIPPDLHSQLTSYLSKYDALMNSINRASSKSLIFLG